jgi:hypothetical protein
MVQDARSYMTFGTGDVVVAEIASQIEIGRNDEAAKQYEQEGHRLVPKPAKNQKNKNKDWTTGEKVAGPAEETPSNSPEIKGHCITESFTDPCAGSWLVTRLLKVRCRQC